MKTKIRPTVGDVLGQRQITQDDLTGNEALPPSSAPDRRTMPGRWDNQDKLEPGKEELYGRESEIDFGEDENSDDEALLDEADHASFVNSQLDPTEELPSTTNVGRFVAQNK